MTGAFVHVVVEGALVAFALGTTVWFFLVQTPALLTRLGMEAFLPLQMRLVRVYARTMAVTALGVLAAATLRLGWQPALLPAAVAAAAAFANAGLFVPRALRAGGQAVRAVRSGEGADAGVASFASVGGGAPTAVWHRVVVAAVVVMTSGLVFHGVGLGGPPMADTPHHAAHALPPDAEGTDRHRPPVDADARWSADPVTAANVATLHARVRALRGTAPDADTVAGLESAFAAIFRDCTMEGDDHEALHDLLVPVGAALGRVAEGDGVDAALSEVDARLAGFDEEFLVEP